MARFRRALRRGTPRRVEWNSTFLYWTPATVAVGTDAYFAGWLSPPSALQSQFTEPTLVRLRGQYSMILSSNAPAVITQAAMGVIPWKSNSDTVPAVGTLPSPLLDGEFDWVYHQFFPTPETQSLAAGTWTVWSGRGPDSGMDSKAMRKMPTGFGLLVVGTVRNMAGNPSSINAGFQIGSRMLFKE